MKFRSIILIFYVVFLFNAVAFSDPPVINYNVHVLQHATASQCTSSWRGKAAPDAMTDVTRFGEGTVESPGLQSCTGCAIDSQSQDCVCKTCYAYFNN